MNGKTILAALMAALMLLTVFAPGAAMAASITADSEIEEDDVIVVEADGDEEYLVIAEETTEDAQLTIYEHIEDDEGAEEYLTLEAEEFDSEADESEFIVTEDEMSDNLPVADGHTEDFELVVYDDTEADEPESDAVEFEVEADGFTINFADGESTEDDGFLGFGSSDVTETTEEVNINGTETDVAVDLGNDAEAFDDAIGIADDAEAVEEGDILPAMTVMVDGQMVPVHYESADTDDTHAVYDDGQIHVELDDDFEDRSTVVVDSSTSNADFSDAWDVYGISGVTSLVLP